MPLKRRRSEINNEKSNSNIYNIPYKEILYISYSAISQYMKM